MLDFSNEIYTAFANAVRTAHAGVKTSSEYVRSPAEFPFSSCDEISNTDVQNLFDSSRAEKFARLQYRIQVFSNNKSGKKAEARSIFATGDAVMKGLGFVRTTYTTTPDIYESTIYQITAIYEAIIDKDGIIYGRE